MGLQAIKSGQMYYFVVAFEQDFMKTFTRFNEIQHIGC